MFNFLVRFLKKFKQVDLLEKDSSKRNGPSGCYWRGIGNDVEKYLNNQFGFVSKLSITLAGEP